MSSQQHRQRVSKRNEVHRFTTKLEREHHVIVAEDLSIRNMTRSARGTLEEPGRYESAKSGLNRSINEQTWELILTQFVYKPEWADREFVNVDPKHTSQTCSARSVVDSAHKTGKDYNCSGCCSHPDADINASLVIVQGTGPPRRAGGWEYVARVRVRRENSDWIGHVNLCQ